MSTGVGKVCLNIVCFLFITGCIDSTNQRTNIPTSPPPTKLSLPETTKEITQTKMPISPALTETPLPEETNEIIATNTPANPSPTLTDLDIENLISSLMATNNNCSKPCFWGLVPGETTISDGIEFINGFRKTVLSGQRETLYYFTTSLTTDELAISITLWERDGMLNNLNVDMGALADEIPISILGVFTPQRILEKYGHPSEVSFYISTSTEVPSSNTIGYGYILTYPGFVAEFYEQRIPAMSPAMVCPLIDPGLVGVKLWFGEDQIDPPVPGIDLGLVTTLTIDDFYSLILSEPDQACFYLDLGVFPP